LSGASTTLSDNSSCGTQEAAVAVVHVHPGGVGSRSVIVLLPHGAGVVILRGLVSPVALDTLGTSVGRLQLVHAFAGLELRHFLLLLAGELPVLVVGYILSGDGKSGWWSAHHLE
jgi:hypothetical protein